MNRGPKGMVKTSIMPVKSLTVDQIRKLHHNLNRSNAFYFHGDEKQIRFHDNNRDWISMDLPSKDEILAVLFELLMTSDLNKTHTIICEMLKELDINDLRRNHDSPMHTGISLFSAIALADLLKYSTEIVQVLNKFLPHLTIEDLRVSVSGTMPYRSGTVFSLFLQSIRCQRNNSKAATVMNFGQNLLETVKTTITLNDLNNFVGEHYGDLFLDIFDLSKPDSSATIIARRLCPMLSVEQLCNSGYLRDHPHLLYRLAKDHNKHPNNSVFAAVWEKHADNFTLDALTKRLIMSQMADTVTATDSVLCQIAHASELDGVFLGILKRHGKSITRDHLKPTYRYEALNKDIKKRKKKEKENEKAKDVDTDELKLDYLCMLCALDQSTPADSATTLVNKICENFEKEKAENLTLTLLQRALEVDNLDIVIKVRKNCQIPLKLFLKESEIYFAKIIEARHHGDIKQEISRTKECATMILMIQPPQDRDEQLQRLASIYVNNQLHSSVLDQPLLDKQWLSTLTSDTEASYVMDHLNLLLLEAKRNQDASQNPTPNDVDNLTKSLNTLSVQPTSLVFSNNNGDTHKSPKKGLFRRRKNKP